MRLSVKGGGHELTSLGPRSPKTSLGFTGLRSTLTRTSFSCGVGTGSSTTFKFFSNSVVVSTTCTFLFSVPIEDQNSSCQDFKTTNIRKQLAATRLSIALENRACSTSLSHCDLLQSLFGSDPSRICNIRTNRVHPVITPFIT